METLELALELRRANYGANGERLGLDLYPYTEDQVGAVRRSVLQWRFIDGVAGRIDDAALRECQQRKDAVGAYEIVLRGAGGRDRCRRRLIGIDVGTTAVKALAVSPCGEVLARAEAAYPLGTPRPGWAEQDPEDWWRATRRRSRRSAAEPAAIGLSGQMHGLVALDAADRVIRPAILWNDQRTQRRVRRDRGARRPRAADRADRQPRADRLHRAEAPVAARPRARGVRADRARAAAQGLRAPAADRRAGDRRGRRVGHAAVRRRRAGVEHELLDALELDPRCCRRRSSRRSSGTTWGRAVVAGGGDQAAGAVGVGVDRPRAAVGRARARAAWSSPRCRPSPPTRGARARVLPCGAGRWHAMGVMLTAAGALRWLQRRPAAGADYDELVRGGRAVGARRRGAARSCPTSPASARRTPIPMRAARSPACRCATTAARSCAPCSRAWRSACATRWTSCASWASDARWRGPPAAGRASDLFLRVVG